MSRKRRLILLALASLAFVTFFNIGANSEIGEQEAKSITEQFREMVKDIDAYGIFLNNFRIALAMFIPALGVAIGLFSAYSTGLVFKALVVTTPELAGLPPLLVLATPFGIMEVISYGIAMSQSGILLHSILKKEGFRPVIIPTLIQIGIVSALLLAGAFIEYYMIRTAMERVQL
ncbi:MAG: stage II sporulation protein M [Candidatus Nitrosocaldus sp.]|nr:stage II sporulation protein M [Candidatus Nitrosocaldus sp.]MDW8000765.1 stage II sporulation protein M [Candidatus Nitrosocaldus sp.]